MSRIAASISVTVLACAMMLGLCSAASAATRDDLLASAVRIRYERTESGALITGHGTAFGVDLTPYGVSSRRLLLSAAHNVLDGRGQPYSTLKIEITDGPRTYWTKVRVVASDEGMDLCLVESAEDLPVLAKLHDADLNPGSPVILAGSPRGVPVALYDGEIMKRFESGSIRSSARVQFDHGDSGGPFFCARTMKVIGVAVAGVPKNGDLDHNIGLFVPLVGVDSFLAAHLPNARKNPVVARVEPRPVAQKANPENIAQNTKPVEPAAPVAQTVAAAPAPAPATPTGPVAMSASAPKVHAEVIDVDTVAVAHAQPPVQQAKLPVPERSAPVKVEAAPAPQIAEVKTEIKKSIAAAPAPVVHAAQQTFVAPPPQVTPPAPAAPAVAAKKTEPVAPIAQPQPKEVSVAQIKEAPKAEKPAKVFHVVQAGENLTKIAKHYKVALTEIVSANGIQDPNRITIGMKVQIPVQ